jgi:hypothetical protein
LPHRFPALTAAPAAGEGRLWLTGARLFDGADPQRIWLVLQLGVPVAERALEQDVGAA